MTVSLASPKLAFVGAGRLGTALALALDHAGHSITSVASRSPGAAIDLAGRLRGARVLDVEDASREADVVFLAVPDDAIFTVARGVRWRHGVVAVHCSGAAGLDVLAAAAEQGAIPGSFHPLQTFAGQPAELQGVTVAIEGPDVLDRIAIELGCRPLRLPPGSKSLYHASSAFASNYLVTLLGQAVRLWRILGCTEQEALRALMPLIKSTVANVERLGPEAALTGPIARGDQGTVCRHLDALAANAPELIELYRQLGLSTLSIAGPSAQHLSTILEGDSTPCA